MALRLISRSICRMIAGMRGARRRCKIRCSRNLSNIRSSSSKRCRVLNACWMSSRLLSGSLVSACWAACRRLQISRWRVRLAAPRDWRSTKLAYTSGLKMRLLRPEPILRHARLLLPVSTGHSERGPLRSLTAASTAFCTAAGVSALTALGKGIVRLATVRFYTHVEQHECHSVWHSCAA